MGSLRSAVADLLRVPWMGLRLLGRHWPALLALCLLGLGLRQGVVWLGVEVSRWSSTLAVLLIPLAGLAMLTTLILMLWATRPSLPSLGPTVPEPGARRRVRAGTAAVTGLLIPFLAIYASQGFLAEDGRTFVRTVVSQEARQNELDMDFGRLDLATGWMYIAIIVIAFLARRIIRALHLERRSTAVGILAAYLEGLWLLTLGVAVASWFDSLVAWLTGRRVIAAIIDAWEALLAALGPIGGAIGWVTSQLGSLSAVIVVPVAWLSVGALVYGAELEAEKKATAEADAAKAAAEAAAAAAASRSARVAAATSTQARRLAREAADPVVGPIEGALKALQKVAVAGILPMVFFCLVFVVSTQIATVAGNLVRWLIGPRDEALSMALEPYAILAGRVCYFMIAVVLLAAAIDRILTQARERGARRAEAERRERAAAEAPEGTEALPA